MKVNAGELTKAIRAATAIFSQDPSVSVSLQFVSDAPIRVRWESSGAGEGVADVACAWEQSWLDGMPPIVISVDADRLLEYLAPIQEGRHAHADRQRCADRDSGSRSSDVRGCRGCR